MPLPEQKAQKISSEHIQPPHVYGPEAIRKEHDRFVFDITVGEHSVTLPMHNAGKEAPVWIAFTDVKQNVELAIAALPEMVNSIYTAIENGAQIDAIVTPQSAKSEAFVRSVTLELSRRLGRVIPLVQLIGSTTDPDSVIKRSAPGLSTECASIVSKAMGITKMIGMTEKDAQILKAVNGNIAWVDDVVSTGVTREKSFYLINKALGKPEGTTYPSFVIQLESEWGPGYPKDFPNQIALYHTPEFSREIPAILRN